MNKIDSLFIVISAILGAVFGMVAEFLFYRFSWIGTGVPMMLICMGVFAGGMSIAMVVRGMMKGDYVNPGKAIALGLVALIIFMGFTGLFEFIYERDITTTRVVTTPTVTTTTTTTTTENGASSSNSGNNQGTSTTTGGYTTEDVERRVVKSALQYVFLIDDSGSMNHPSWGNDQDDKRYDAVEQVVRGFNGYNKFAVYRFGTNLTVDVEMGAADASTYKFNRAGVKDGGETYLLTAIDKIIDRVDTSNIATNIIVLTDGAPSDYRRYDRVVDKCNSKNVMVSCIGFGDADEAFLRQITDDTKGIHVINNDLSMLLHDVGQVVEYVTETTRVPAENNANTNINNNTQPNTNTSSNTNTQEGTTTKITTTTSNDTDLLGRRNPLHPSGLHMFMRIIFLIVLAFIWTVVKQLLSTDRNFSMSAAIITFVIAAVAALVVEFFIPFMPGILVRLVFYAMWGLTIVPEFEEVRTSMSGNVEFGGYTPLERNNADDFWNTPSTPGGTNSFM